MSVLQLKTYSDIYTAIREELSVGSSDTTFINRIKRDINIIYEEVVGHKEWSWLYGHCSLTLPAYFSTGTAAIVSGASIVTFTTAPGPSKKGYFFATDQHNENYRIGSHSAGSTTAILESTFTGTTETAGTFKVWSDRLPLPTDCKEVTKVWHDFYGMPMDESSLDEYRRLSTRSPRAEGRPKVFYLGDYVDPRPTSSITSLSATSYRSSAGTVKTLVFASSLPTAVVTKINNGDPIRWRISGCAKSSYNADVTISAVSTTTVANDTITYVAPIEEQESSTADASISVVQIDAEQDYDRYRELYVYPSLNSTNTTLHVDYIRDIQPLDNDSDEPLIPKEFRGVLFYGALAKAYRRTTNLEMAQYMESKYQAILAKMEGKLQENQDKPRLTPSKWYLATKRNQTRARNFDDTGMTGSGGGSSGAVVTGTPSSVATFDANGNLVGSTTIDTTELGCLDGVTSNIQTQLNDITTLASGKIYIGNSSNVATEVTPAGDVTIDNTGTTAISAGVIVNADISASAAIARSKTASGTAYRVLANDSSGVMSENAAITASRAVASDANGQLVASSTTATELGYVNGVTSAIQTQLNAKQTSDNDLTALAALSTTGIATRTATDTWTTRTVTGTTNQISVTNGDGVSGNPTLAIASDVVLPGTGGAVLPTGTTAQRPGSPTNGLIRYNSDSSSFEGYKGGAWGALGGSSAGINYLSANPDAEAGTTGWATYADAAANTPADGTGGAPSSTWTRTTTSPLRGTGAFLWTKAGGANRQGEGVSYDFTIDSADQARVLSITFDYKIASGTFTASNGTTAPLNDGTTSTNSGNSDLEVFVYDKTNAVLIPVSPQVFTSNSTISAPFKGTFQTASNSTSYRLIVHTATTTTNNFTVQFDNFYVGPQAVVFGPPVTDPVAWTPTFTGFGTVSNVNFTSWRDGAFLCFQGFVTAGTVTATELRMSLGFNGTDGNVTTVSTLPTLSVVGYGQSARTVPDVIAVLAEASKTYVTFAVANGSNSGLSKTSGANIASSIGYSIFGRVPIAGWSSSVQMSNDADTRVVAAIYACSASGTSISSTQQLNYDTKIKDTHGAVTTGSGWKFTAPVSGFYHVDLSMELTAQRAAQVFVNGVASTIINLVAAGVPGGGSTTVYLNAGDYIDMRVTGAATTTDISNTISNVISIYKLSGPSAIAASESVSARYYTTAGQSIPNSSATTINFDTRSHDSHNAVTTGASWKFTAPISGKYAVKVGTSLASASMVSTAIIDVNLAKNGSAISCVGWMSVQANNTMQMSTQGSDTVQLLAGDTISVTMFQNNGGARSLSTDSRYNFIAIDRVGN